MKLDESGRLFVSGDNSFGQLGLGEVQHSTVFICILPAHKVKLFSSILHHTIIVTVENRVFYCGKSRGKLPQSSFPQ
jgi:alpha-tubulin suppressor-like RCC1 family protein